MGGRIGRRGLGARARLDVAGSVLLFLVLAAGASGQTITEFALPSGSTAPFEIVTGPDGNLWFTEFSTNPKIGRMTTAGAITEFLVPGPEATPAGIVAAPDGNLWFTQADFEFGFAAASISRITPAGEITRFRAGTFPYAIALGSDGAFWFTESNIQANTIGRITTAGAVTTYRIPTSGYPIGITAGPGGSLWFTEYAGKIGRITTSGAITEFRISSYAPDITAGPDGNLWFTEAEINRIGRMTTGGVVTEFSIPTAGSGPRGITAGPDGNLWFTEELANKIGRITPDGVITEFPIPTPGSRPVGITTGPDGNVWFTEATANKIGRLSLHGAPAIDMRILPVVGSTAGAGGSFFKTSVQLHNPTSASIAGRITFRRSGAPGSGSAPALSYELAPGQTRSIDDLLPEMGQAGLGSADIEVTAGEVPVTTVRVFNDAGAQGTTGFTEEPMRREDVLQAEAPGVLLVPADLTRFRFNLGVRTLGTEATATLTLRDASGATVTTVSREFSPIYHEQRSAGEFLGGSTLPAGGSIGISMTSGSAIFYGATVDNTTGDPSMQIARPAPLR
jgi:streptogramin lyase